MRSSSSMPRLALRLLLFCFPLAFGWAVLEWGMANVPNSHSVKRAGLERLSAQLDTLIVGSSNAYFGISPRQIDGEAFNLANVSQTLYFDDQLVTSWLPRLPKLKRVIVSVFYISLSFQLHDSDEYWRQYYYNHGWGIGPPRKEDRRSLRMWSRVALYGPRLSLDCLRKGFRVNLGEGVDDRGWYQVPTAHGQSDLSEGAATKRVEYHHRLMRRENEAANLASVDHLVSTLQARGVEVVLVTLPVSPSYAATMNSQRWAETQAHVNRLATRYGVRYLDFLRETRLSSEDFSDLDHLSARGAVRFTTLLNTALRTKADGTVRPASIETSQDPNKGSRHP